MPSSSKEIARPDIRQGVVSIVKRKAVYYKYKGAVIGVDSFGKTDADGKGQRTWYVSKYSADSFKRKIKFPAQQSPNFADIDEMLDWIEGVVSAKRQNATVTPAQPPTPQPLSPKAVGSIKVSQKDAPPMSKLKNKGPEKPDDAEVITTYDMLEETLNAFAKNVGQEQGCKFLLIIGKGGKGKTESVKATLERHGFKENEGDGGFGYTKGRKSPIEMYQFLYDFRDLPIVLDDIDELLRQKGMPALLQSATETKTPRLVSWDTRALGEDGDVPRRFHTASPVVVITNEWQSANYVIKSIEDRAHSIYFNPSNEELHTVYVPRWFGAAKGQKEVYNYIGERLAFVPTLSCRKYTLGAGFKRDYPHNWKERLDSILIPSTEFADYLALMLLADDSYKTDKERIEEFKRRGGGSEITFKRIKAEHGLSRQNRPSDGDDGRKTRWES